MNNLKEVEVKVNIGDLSILINNYFKEYDLKVNFIKKEEAFGIFVLVLYADNTCIEFEFESIEITIKKITAGL